MICDMKWVEGVEDAEGGRPVGEREKKLYAVIAIGEKLVAY